MLTTGRYGFPRSEALQVAGPSGLNSAAHTSGTGRAPAPLQSAQSAGAVADIGKWRNRQWQGIK